MKRHPHARSGTHLSLLGMALSLSILPACACDSTELGLTDGGPVDAQLADARVDALTDGGPVDAQLADAHVDEATDGGADASPDSGLVCQSGVRGCDESGHVAVCREDGSGWDTIEECDVAAGEGCDLGACRNLCALAIERPGHLGCEFYAADLDNASIDARADASSQPFVVFVLNPGRTAADITIEIDTGAFGGDTHTRAVRTAHIAPGDLDALELPRREVDGSSSFSPCDSDAMCNSASQQCWCENGLRPNDDGATECRCRSSALGSGLDDGTHSALTAHAYRIVSTVPVAVFQFNPLGAPNGFSSDASLLLPTSAIGERYMVVAWPQTIAHSDLPAEDWDSSRDDEDLRSFLTIIGTKAGTQVSVTLGPLVRQVVGLPGSPSYGPGAVIELELGAFDVINLETQGFNANFTGTTVTTTDSEHPVSVFVGSEASDAPVFTDLADRQCCADHLEAQLYPSDALGRHFFIGRAPSRITALNRAFLGSDRVSEIDEPHYVRIIAATAGTTMISTSMPAPNDMLELEQGESFLLETTQDLELNASAAIAVIQVLPSQKAAGVPSVYPGGDPSMISVAPVEQWPSDYAFVTPPGYGFDFVTVIARASATVFLDDRPLTEFDCAVGPADGVMRDREAPPAEWLTYRCQLSFPDVIGLPNVSVHDGIQGDGYHTVRANDPISVVVSGFHAFQSYAFTAGTNVRSLE